MTELTSSEHRVQAFHDSALPCHEKLMGDRWHHADPDTLAAGLPRLRGCEIPEERIAGLCGLGAGDRALDSGSGIGGPDLQRAHGRRRLAGRGRARPVRRHALLEYRAGRRDTPVGELRGPEQQMFRRGEEALADARRAGVCSIALWLATNRPDIPV